jgi:hypothetical protein
MSKFKLGLDLHGVIDAIPEEMAFLSKAVVDAGGEVHILTGSTLDSKTYDLLTKHGIKCTHVFSIYDYLMSRSTPTVGEIKFPDGDVQKQFIYGAWDRVKGDYCARWKISLHIDDTLIYNEHFSTPFARLWTHNGKVKASHKPHRHID